MSGVSLETALGCPDPRDDPGDVFDLACREIEQGLAGQAEPRLRALLQAGHADGEIYFALGLALMRLAQHEEATQMFFEAARRAPGRIEFWYTYGGALLQIERNKTAEAVFQHVIDQQPENADARYFLAIACMRQEHWPTAVRQLKMVVEADPQNARAAQALAAATGNAEKTNPFELGMAAQAKAENEEAVYWFEEAHRLSPKDSRPLWQLAVTFTILERLEEAIATYRKVMALEDANKIPALRNIAWIYSQKLMDAEATVRLSRETLAATSDPEAQEVARHEILFFLPTTRGVTPRELKDEAVAWQKAFGTGVIPARSGHANDPDPERRIRVGFFSRLFGRWSYSRQIQPMLRHNDPAAFEIYCYQTSREPVEPIIGAETAHWRELHGRSDEEMADLIQQDEIDILIDCNGHTKVCGNGVFCRRPAPVQVGWSNKAMTTGSETMDYFIFDAVSVAGFDQFFVEKLYQLPCYHVPYPMVSETPPVGPLPFERNGYFTFGTLATPYKFSEAVWGVWARVLNAIPESKFHIKNSFGGKAGFRENAWQRFEEHGVDRSRITFGDGGPHYEFLKGYDEIDVALDTMPCPGGNTLVEGLWQGVPAVSKLGSWWVLRASLAILSEVGLADHVARNDDEYVAIAVEISKHPEKLAALRADLRRRMEQSSLVNGATFSGHFQDALRFMWREWCRWKRTGAPMRAGPLLRPEPADARRRTPTS